MVNRVFPKIFGTAAEPLTTLQIAGYALWLPAIFLIREDQLDGLILLYAVESVVTVDEAELCITRGDKIGTFAIACREPHAVLAHLLQKGLGARITPKGKAMRCGSVIARIQVPATPRPYEDHHAYCLFFSSGTCGQCISRCPSGAITKAGHDL
jgi:ferredoxin